jgi:serine protease inhibitor
MRKQMQVLALATGLFVSTASSPGNAQAGDREGSPLPVLMQGNEQFGLKLLAEMHRAQPEKNVVVAPLPLTLMLAAVQTEARLQETHKELDSVFGWGAYPQHLPIASRMLLGAFQRPTEKQLALRAQRWHGDMNPPGMESAWIASSISYKPDKNGRSPFSPQFLIDGSTYYGIDFQPVSKTAPPQWTAGLPSDPKVNVFFNTRMHVQMVWRGNTFSDSKPFQGAFQPPTGAANQVEMQTSDLSQYPHAKTDLYEAAVLPCYGGTMTVVLPAQGVSIAQVEEALAVDPEALDRKLTKQAGFITMPTIHLEESASLRAPLEALGIHQIFRSLGNIAIGPSRVGMVAQKLDLQINRDGIRGDSETVMGMVMLGMMMAPEPFSFELNRPFIFLIHDGNSGALTYVGAVMDPSER